jgi:hypothetical protein
MPSCEKNDGDKELLRSMSLLICCIDPQQTAAAAAAANKTHLGAVTLSKVKVTSGGLLPSPPRPRRTTVSPLRTDLTLAVPRLGRMGGSVAVGRDIVVI